MSFAAADDAAITDAEMVKLMNYLEESEEVILAGNSSPDFLENLKKDLSFCVKMKPGPERTELETALKQRVADGVAKGKGKGKSFAAAEAMAPKTASSTYSSSEDERQVCGFYSIKKYFDGGPTVSEGFFKIKVRKVEMTEDFFVHNYELCCPIFKHGEYIARDITLGVKPDSSWQVWDGNGVASLLFNQNLPSSELLAQ